MSSWLYPISSGPGNYFEDKRGRGIRSVLQPTPPRTCTWLIHSYER